MLRASQISRALRSLAVTLIANPAPLPPVALVAAPATSDYFAPDDMPALVDIEAAAEAHDIAAELARRGDRGKRKARKLLDRLPSGTYGPWTVERKPSSRTTPDLPAIEAIFRAHGLGDVPMRPVADSLVVRRVAVVEVPVELVAVAA